MRFVGGAKVLKGQAPGGEGLFDFHPLFEAHTGIWGESRAVLSGVLCGARLEIHISILLLGTQPSSLKHTFDHFKVPKVSHVFILMSVCLNVFLLTRTIVSCFKMVSRRWK